MTVEVDSEARALAVALRRAGLEPASLAAAGVGTSSFAGLLTAADGWLIENAQSLEAADAQLGQARVQRDALRRLVLSGKGSGTEAEELEQAKSTHGNALAARDAALDSLFAAATANLAGGQITTLQWIRANSRWKLPAPYRAEEREAAVWLSLRHALANERIAPRLDEDPSVEAQTFLAQMRARQAVSQAQAASDTYLAALKASWQASLSGAH